MFFNKKNNKKKEQEIKKPRLLSNKDVCIEFMEKKKYLDLKNVENPLPELRQNPWYFEHRRSFNEKYDTDPRGSNFKYTLYPMHTIKKITISPSESERNIRYD